MEPRGGAGPPHGGAGPPRGGAEPPHRGAEPPRGGAGPPHGWQFGQPDPALAAPTVQRVPRPEGSEGCTGTANHPHNPSERQQAQGETWDAAAGTAGKSHHIPWAFALVLDVCVHLADKAIHSRGCLPVNLHQYLYTSNLKSEHWNTPSWIFLKGEIPS